MATKNKRTLSVELPEIVPTEILHRVVHSNEPQAPKFNVKLERNTKGYNWEITLLGVESVEQAVAMLTDARGKLETQFNEPVTLTKAS